MCDRQTDRHTDTNIHVVRPVSSGTNNVNTITISFIILLKTQIYFTSMVLILNININSNKILTVWQFLHLIRCRKKCAYAPLESGWWSRPSRSSFKWVVWVTWEGWVVTTSLESNSNMTPHFTHWGNLSECFCKYIYVYIVCALCVWLCALHCVYDCVV